MRALCLVLGILIFGCSVPDDDNWERVKEGIVALPPPALADAKRWAANSNATRYLEDEDQDQEVFRLWCGAFEMKPMIVTVKDLLLCLDGVGTLTFRECLAKILAQKITEAEKALGRSLSLGIPMQTPGFDSKNSCVQQFSPDWRHPASIYLPLVLPGWDPETVGEDDVERDLIQSPRIPAWLPYVIVGGVILLSGQPEFFPALCALGDSAACPSDPNYPPNATPQPGAGGGSP